MNRLAELFISFFELIEAEGREMRYQAECVLRAAVLSFFGGAIMTAGVIAAAFALYFALTPKIGKPAGALIAAAALFAGGAFLTAKSQSLGRALREEAAETKDGTAENDEGK